MSDNVNGAPVFKKGCCAMQNGLGSRLRGRIVVLGAILVGLIAVYWLWSATDDRSADQESNVFASFSKIEDRDLDVIVAFMNRNGSIVVREFGALRDDGLAPEKTLVDIGSITKTIAAIAILKLVEHKRLKLNETLAAFWTDAPADKASITVHQLLTHTSGLPNVVGKDHERLSRGRFIDRVMRVRLVQAPGGKYHYSNVGYGMLAAIIELRSGKSFETYLKEDILAPADLDPIGYENTYDDKRSLLSPRIWLTWFQKLPIWEASWGGHPPGWNLVGNGGLVTTPVGYLRFWSAVRQGRVVNKVLLSKALTPHVDKQKRQEIFYGYGLMVQNISKLGRMYGHDGSSANDSFSSDWRELSSTGLILFAAGRGTDAEEAMRLILREQPIPDRLFSRQ